MRARELDLLIMPLVAMDARGNRLGMGGGYYDRTLANFANGALQPVLVGVGYQFQLVEKIETQPWDVPLDWIATDAGLQAAAVHSGREHG